MSFTETYMPFSGFNVSVFKLMKAPMSIWKRENIQTYSSKKLSAIKGYSTKISILKSRFRGSVSQQSVYGTNSFKWMQAFFPFYF